MVIKKVFAQYAQIKAVWMVSMHEGSQRTLIQLLKDCTWGTDIYGNVLVVEKIPGAEQRRAKTNYIEIVNRSQ